MPDGYFYRALVLRVLGAESRRPCGRCSTARSRRPTAERRPTSCRTSASSAIPAGCARARSSTSAAGSSRCSPRRSTTGSARVGCGRSRSPATSSSLRSSISCCGSGSRSASRCRAAALALLVEPLRAWSSSPLTDSWGLALGTAALVFGCLALTRDARWLAAWAAAVLVLGFTRDLTLVLVGAALLTAFLVRSGRALALAGTGVVAALPAPLLFGAPLKAAIAYPLNGYYPVDDPSWSYIADRYVGGAKALAKSDLSYIAHHPLSTAILIAGTLAVALLPPKGAAASCLVGRPGRARLPAPDAELHRVPARARLPAARGARARRARAAARGDQAAERRAGAPGTARRAARPRSRAAGRSRRRRARRCGCCGPSSCARLPARRPSPARPPSQA